MSLPCDRRAAFAYLYPRKKQNIHERRWCAGQGAEFAAMPAELRALTALLMLHREQSLAADRVARGEEVEWERAETRRVESEERDAAIAEKEPLFARLQQVAKERDALRAELDALKALDDAKEKP